MASQTEYKFSYITHWDNLTQADGTRTEWRTSINEGEISEQPEEVDEGVFELITRYRRSATLTRSLDDFQDIPNLLSADADGSLVIVKVSDVLTDDEVRAVMGTVLAKDLTRTPIDEQKVIV